MMSSLRKPIAHSYRLLTSPLRVLPDYLIIGTIKGGTTSLQKYLGMHPQVRSPFKKEIHFFGERTFQNGVLWYRSFFPLQSFFSTQSFVTGEASPEYFFKRDVAARVASLLPNAKLILLLRNPIDKVYSHYAHRLQKGIEPDSSFERVVMQEMDILQKSLHEMETTHHYGYHPCFKESIYLVKGVYSIPLCVWLTMFSREQLLVLKSEDLFEEPSSIFKQTLQFLGLPLWEPDRYEVYNSGRYAEISEDLREKLNQFYQSHNRHLYDSLGRDFSWT